MPSRKEKISLFIFIDAFGWEVAKRHPDYLKDLIVDSKPLKTILGYSSACDPSIISGLTPGEHKLWSSYYYDPENSPFKWTRPLRLLPDFIFRRGRVRGRMSKWIKKRCRFTGYFQLYAVPFKLLSSFNYAEKKRIWEPGGLPCGQSVFDRMTEAGISYYTHKSDVDDTIRLDNLTAQVRKSTLDFAYCSLGRLDGLMHTKGNDDPSIDPLMQWYDKKIRELLQTASEHYAEVSWYVFTDHGMHNVTESCDLISDMEALGLQWDQDYVAFYDSTMLRVWFLNDAARAPITTFLEKHPKGRILSAGELKEMGVFFEDGQYGDLIFLMNSGIQIVPSFMGSKSLKGMHGYHPADPDSYASISSNRPIPDSIKKIQHIHQLMLSELELD